MSSGDPRSLQLDELAQVAFRLGKAFGQEAEQAGTLERKVEFFHLFDRSFAAFRLGIALQLRLRREAASPAERADEREDERPEALERDRPECAERPDRYDERDRERDRERASLPLLLRTLQGVADAAAALPGPEPADLQTLRELLAQVKAQPAAAPQRAPAPALRARLSGSTATVTPPRPNLPRPSLHDAAPVRRATGPP